MTTKERQQRLILARRLRANGVPLEIDGEEEAAGLRRHQIGADPENCAFDLRNGGTGYMVNVSLTITQRAFALAGIALELLWTDCGLSLIDDPLESGARYGHYWFPGNDTLAFERRAVINHRVDVRRLPRRGTTIEGLLLWVGLEPIPDAFLHGVHFPATVVVFDQYDNRYPLEVSLWANRTERGTGDKHSRKSRGRLFSKRDPSPVHSRSGTNPIGVGVAGDGSSSS